MKKLRLEFLRCCWFYHTAKYRSDIFPHLDRIGLLRYAGRHRLFTIDLIICIKHNNPDNIEAKNGIIWGGMYGNNYGLQIGSNSFIGFQIDSTIIDREDYENYYYKSKKYREKKPKKADKYFQKYLQLRADRERGV